MRWERHIRVVIDGISGFEREILHGVCDHINRERLPWRIEIGLRPTSEQLQTWTPCDGLVLACSSQPVADWIVSHRYRAVNCFSHFEPMGIPTVRVDDDAVGEQAAAHLIDRGFDNLVYYATTDRSLAALRRWEGFHRRATAAAVRCRFLPGTVAPPDGCVAINWAGLAREVRRTGRPAGLFLSFDLLVLDAAREFFARGIRVPDQVALVGADNDQLICELSQPPLSSVELPGRRIGEEAAARLACLLDGKRVSVAPLVVPPVGVVARPSSDTLAIQSPDLRRAVAWLRGHACDPCTVKDVARQVGMSRRALELACESQLRLTPHAAIMQVRLVRARQLLRDNHLSLSAVGAACGYPLPQNFVRAFHAATGETPAACRRRTSG